MYGDAPRARSYTATHASQYNQIKRWAWGATDIPYVTSRMLSHPEIPWRLRARRYSNLIFNHLTWATLPMLLFFGGALPAFIDLDYSLSSTSALLGSLSASILTITLLNTLLLVQVDYRICPKPKEWPWWRRRWAELQLFTYPGRRTGAQRDPRARGTDPADVRRVPRIPRHGKGLAHGDVSAQARAR